MHCPKITRSIDNHIPREFKYSFAAFACYFVLTAFGALYWYEAITWIRFTFIGSCFGMSLLEFPPLNSKGKPYALQEYNGRILTGSNEEFRKMSECESVSSSLISLLQRFRLNFHGCTGQKVDESLDCGRREVIFSD